MKKKHLHSILPGILLSLLTILFSCNSEIDIRQDYDFEVRMQKYRTEISEGETKELEFFIDKEGNYDHTKYYVSVFLRLGKGVITTDKDKMMNDNQYYEVPASGFKLYYTSQSAETHKIEILVKDSFGKEKETVVTLSNK
ncbi:TraQ conjugal transfer family protein [Massilibacteroides vaginae]|uniref:TraQ conjugal transfer family protein n=1 Tax=Massilibacteroides vaginae TaxID=1673718 RepID=UPI000A1CF28F|nr:TraQ conjugal transfer family protein [Massilibacteroides vaginae]